jgi:lipopolysaccharide/colanic/teichoic acid biosynthesis glycosyltransferase
MQKRTFDIFLSLIALILLGWLLLIIFISVSLSYRGKGIFLQQRVGRHGKLFAIFKFRTMHPETKKIGRFSQFLRDSKIDEMPQLINVLIGDMSFVGPRPDIPGYYDKLEGEARKILELRPGITSIASLKYKNEEAELAKQNDPLRHTDEVLFPDKVRLNLDYYYRRTFRYDIKIIFWTVFGYNKTRL